MPTDALARAIAAFIAAAPDGNPYETALPGLTLLRHDCTMPPMPLVYRPAVCFVAQGAKSGSFGARRLEYRAGQGLVVGVALPGIGRVIEASAGRPFLGGILELDLAALRDVLGTLVAPLAPRRSELEAVTVATFEEPVIDCLLRLVRLLATPHAVPALAPAIMRELSYWLLAGPNGGDVAAVVLGHDRPAGIVAALHAIRTRYAESVSVDELASLAGMSARAFHRAFKALTATTPVQYRKQMRLLEARNLMLLESAGAESAAYRVGYESPSQFSREYVRMFGAPPGRDIAAVRGGAIAPERPTQTRPSSDLTYAPV